MRRGCSLVKVLAAVARARARWRPAPIALSARGVARRARDPARRPRHGVLSRRTGRPEPDAAPARRRDRAARAQQRGRRDDARLRDPRLEGGHQARSRTGKKRPSTFRAPDQPASQTYRVPAARRMMQRYDTWSNDPAARRSRSRGRESAPTSAGCFTPSPTATTSSPACSRSGRIAAGRRGSSRSPDVRPGTRALDLACGTGDIAFGLGRAAPASSASTSRHRMLQLARGEGAAPRRAVHASSPAT